MSAYPIYRTSKGGQDVFAGEVEASSPIAAVEEWAARIGIEDYSIDQRSGNVYVCPANSVLFYYTWAEGDRSSDYDQRLYRESYNAHERAETLACEAMYAHLQTCSIEALACLADPQWNWRTRSHMSATIIDYASEVLDEKLEAAYAGDSAAAL